MTGSIEEGETALQAAVREVKEEVTIDVAAEQLTLIDCQRTVEFEIFSHLRHRYAPASCTIQNSGSALRYRMSGR
ncbi:Dihydroneopterin triphosphate pyrophosphatase [Salmonella enterica subsp. enterica]|uniref:Dihydroneopterin triphosphate pyrophosphatase n=1 Tax=Salmonella enterica I TaxID=59201 RepID=A0A3S4FJG8_SALET|nr:Dihydroneopterin triphosphate pyrophosphatase [Salmonella enterica subsp. enterica]